MIVCCLLVIGVLLSPATAAVGAVETPYGIETGPSNVAVLAGESVTLTCRTDGVSGSNIRWAEFITNPSGALISDGSIIVPSHPNYDRYQIITDETGRTFSLKISNVVLNDAGFYMCMDSNAALPSTFRLGAQLVVIAAPPTCTQTFPTDGFTIEGQYYTAECLLSYRAWEGIAPLMTWIGPETFQQVSFTTNTSVYAGMQFNAERSMAGQNWVCKTNFTTKGFDRAPDTALNAPSWQHFSPTNLINVHWPPVNLTVKPAQTVFEVDDTITCEADANPQAVYIWQSLRTSEIWYNNPVTLRSDMVGYQMMRCTARNVLQEVSYSRDIFVEVTVNAATTTPLPTTTTTTTAPAWAECSDITGRWEAVNPNASICITVDHANNAQLIGLYRNGSDTFWLQLIGKTREGMYGESGWTVLWPSPSVGVSSFAVECSRCYGVDQLVARGISRSTNDNYFCGYGGGVRSSTTYTFHRAPLSWPCSASYEELLSNAELAGQGVLRA